MPEPRLSNDGAVEAMSGQDLNAKLGRFSGVNCPSFGGSVAYISYPHCAGDVDVGPLGGSMIPTWLVVDKVIQEMDSVRRDGGGVTGDGDVDQALSDADVSVRALTLASDAETVHQAWRAVARAEAAVQNAIRVSSPRRRAR